MTAQVAARPDATRTAAQEIRRLRAELAAVTDERDHLAVMLAAAVGLSAPDPRADQLRRLEHAETWQAGYDEGERAGYRRAVTEYKRAQRQAVANLEVYLARWDGRPREQFGDPRPGDFPGGRSAT